MTDALDRTTISAEPAAGEALGAAAVDAWRWQPYAIVFVSSACIMILELVAGRIVAPYVGVSLYTWTSIIGVVLAGISLGNYLGGRLADRWGSMRLLGLLFLLAGLASFGVLAVDWLGQSISSQWPIVLRIVALVTALFFVPCVILGTISPVVAKLAVRDLARTGTTVGKIYAAGTVGSIVGTFLTGFVLIAWFGAHAIVWGVALVLIGLGLLFVFAKSRQTMAGGLLLGLVGLALAGNLTLRQGWLRGSCNLETNYFCITVKEQERGGKVVRVLILDRLVHSYTSLDDPRELIYGYEKMYAEATAYRNQQDDHLRALFIGGGGYTFPRYMETLYPGSAIDVVEIDPGVTLVAHELLGLARDTSIVTYNEDARLFLQREPGQKYDLIMGDAFNDFSVPYHLTTWEFNERVRAWLAEDGLYLVNIIDGPTGNFLRAYSNTLRQTFPHVYLAPTSEGWRESPRTTFVVIASAQPLDRNALASLDAGDGQALLARQLLSDDQLSALLGQGEAVVLSDRFAPVDQMLAPAFREEAPD